MEAKTKAQIAEELRRDKTKNMRYKKAVCAELNLENIQNSLFDMGEACSNFRYYTEQDDGSMLDELIGDEEESWELRNAYSMLSGDCEQMYDDIQNEFVPEFFDDFFGSIAQQKMLGFDSYEGDYFGLSSYEEPWAREECEKRLMAHTKAEIIDAYGICFRIAVNYISIKNRYDSLQVYTEILNGVNSGVLATVKRLEEIYDEQIEKNWPEWWEFDKLTAALPPETWIQ